MKKLVTIIAAVSASILATKMSSADVAEGDRSPAAEARTGVADGPLTIGGSVGFDIGRLGLSLDLKHGSGSSAGSFDSRFGLQLTYDVIRTKRSRVYGVGRLLVRAQTVPLAPNSVAVKRVLRDEAGFGVGTEVMTCTELFAEVNSGSESVRSGSFRGAGIVGLRFRDWN